MAKNIIFNRNFLYIIFIFSSFIFHSCIKWPDRKEIIEKNLRSDFVPVKPKELSPLEKTVKAYSDKVGWKEKTGRNDGKNIEYILSNVGLKKGDPWCAAFVYTCFMEAGVITVPKSGYSPNWFPKDNTYYIKGIRGNLKARQADVFGIYIASKKRIGHVGFVDVWNEDDSKFISVEGNTSLENNGKTSYEGEGVERKRRLKSQINKLSRWI